MVHLESGLHLQTSGGRTLFVGYQSSPKIGSVGPPGYDKLNISNAQINNVGDRYLNSKVIQRRFELGNTPALVEHLMPL